MSSLRGVVRRRGFVPRAFSSCDEAYAEIEALDDPPAGALIDVCLDHGRLGFELVHLIRRRFRCPIPVMLFTGYPPHEFAFQRRALEVDAELFEKPVSMKELADFLVRAALSPLQLHPAMYQAVVGLAADYALLPHEVRIVGHLGVGSTRSMLPTHLGVSSDTVKWQLKRLLAKTGTKNTRELLSILLRNAGVFSR